MTLCAEVDDRGRIDGECFCVSITECNPEKGWATLGLIYCCYAAIIMLKIDLS
ncbi:hypothetical protein SAMN05421760_102357 [Neptunomonas antarctica]|uniref:Uncharacterized protein n=1 Tax=Neptunomonas antarctica TaxID=619304 RepID=A0A1N7KDZ6_9GAMM|nr:hypothetical protein SAMN05421760_102357 [Neptunomonas antarctica]